MKLYRCCFLDRNKKPKSGEYTYASFDDPVVGEIVVTPDGKEVVVTEVDVSPDSIKGIEHKLKYVTRLPETGDDPMPEIIEASFEEIDSQETKVEITLELPDLSVNKDNLAIVEQLPIITEQLKVFSVEMDNIVLAAEAMQCTDANRQKIKKHRQKINALLTEFEKRRIAIKNEILVPYETFNKDYEVCVKEKAKKALNALDTQITSIESGIIQNLRDDVEGYFYEYLADKNIDWLTWEQSGIKVGLSDNKTALRRKASEFIDRIFADLAIIETQEYKSEITIEYKKNLNLMNAISTVQARAKAIAEQERIRAEREEQRKIQEEQRRLQAEAIEKAVGTSSASTNAPLSAPSRPAAPLDQPKAAEKPITTDLSTKKYSVAFKVKNETPERLAVLKKYMVDNGYSYIQVPLKNIIESEAM